MADHFVSSLRDKLELQRHLLLMAQMVGSTTSATQQVPEALKPQPIFTSAHQTNPTDYATSALIGGQHHFPIGEAYKMPQQQNFARQFELLAQQCRAVQQQHVVPSTMPSGYFASIASQQQSPMIDTVTKQSPDYGTKASDYGTNTVEPLSPASAILWRTILAAQTAGSPAASVQKCTANNLPKKCEFSVPPKIGNSANLGQRPAVPTTTVAAAEPTKAPNWCYGATKAMAMDPELIPIKGANFDNQKLNGHEDMKMEEDTIAAINGKPQQLLQQFSQHQLQLIMQHFIQLQQQQNANKPQVPQDVHEQRKSSAEDMVHVDRAVEEDRNKTPKNEDLCQNVPKCRPSSSSVESMDIAEEEPACDDYVDVVGDGGQGRSSQMRFQRKAHIEFYRKLKSLRARGVGTMLECQLCTEPVTNTDATVRSHLHAHCATALFVCKLCQRGFQDQHLVFEHINKEHPTRKGTQCIEDRRDMAHLMELLADCFPRMPCKSKDALLEHIRRLLALQLEHVDGDQQQLQCRLCGVGVPADKNALHAHLSMHPMLRCKKCKFVAMTEPEQQAHQRAEHRPNDVISQDTVGQPYCVSVAADVLLDTMRMCFPLPENSASGTTMECAAESARKKSAEGEAAEPPKPKGRRRKTMDEAEAAVLVGRGRKRKERTSTDAE